MFCSTVLVANLALAQEVEEIVRAEVLEVVSVAEREIIGTGASSTVQTLRVELLEGARAGEVVTLENELVILEDGDQIFVNRIVNAGGTEYITFRDVERRPQLLWFVGVMVGLVILFAGWQGARALLSLSISVAGIMFLLVPALLAGYPPALASLIVAGFILSVILFVTHGFGGRVFIAYAGTMAAVAVTCALAWLATTTLRLSGFSSDASVYLNFSTNGALDMSGLLLGSIIIGLLGVLDDVAITQASVVAELKRANAMLNLRELYTGAIRVGRDHVGSLVNTLALAYVGTALPLILLYSSGNTNWWTALSQEVIAAEVIRIVLGSIGLVLAVPLTTLFASWYYAKRVAPEEEVGHHHGHHHHH